MASLKVGENKEIDTDLIQKACSLAVKAHNKSPQKSYILEKTAGSSYVIFSFPGYWSENDWYDGELFGETKINLELFPSLRSIGIDEHAKVNKAFLQRFVDKIWRNQDFINEVEKAKNKKKQIVFTGHSTGGSIAILATIWFLEKYWRLDASVASPLCLTFGCPLTGNHIFSHALRREQWAPYFIHFVMRYDIVPRILLAPISSIKQEFQPILQFLNPKSTRARASTNTPPEASHFYTNVMKNASSVVSHAACNLMGNTNLLLETLSNFIPLSPYKPFGTYVFCTGNGKLVILSNPDAVLQLLFYSSQLCRDCEEERTAIAQRSLLQHFSYDNELQDSFQMLNEVNLDPQLEQLPLSSDSTSSDIAINSALNDLELSTRARLCLRAAGELEKRKIGNKNSIDLKKADIAMKYLQEYQLSCENQGLGYYDAFKIQNSTKDFEANVKRLELAGIWDEIIEMLKRYDLPDAFEGETEWIDLGTEYRRLVEPLDIANFYRHGKNDDTGAYTAKGRPKRYKFTQRWFEHAQGKLPGSYGESCFWADVEELRIKTSGKEGFAPFKDKVLALEKQAKKWIDDKVLGKDVLLEKSTFVVWWKKQPEPHASCINDHECLASMLIS
ncbi:protein EDS1 [Quercus suber]|nr:protein EDS1-like [Quercus suber]POE67667.1 protein eds1l [Quercus suber]